MKEFKESNNRMNLAKKGFKVIRACMHWQSNTWRINYYTLKGGWDRETSFSKLVAYYTKEEAEAHIDKLVNTFPNIFIKDI